MEIEFDRSVTRFALFKNNFIICILPDKHEKLTVFEEKELVELTGSELVKIHINKHYKLVKEISRSRPTNRPIDQNVINRKGAFKALKSRRLRPPIPVKYVENIDLKFVETVRSTIFCNKEGQMFDLPENLPSDELAQLAKVLNAEFVLADFEVTTEYLEKASPFRSQTEI